MNLRDAFRQQAEACAALGSPFMARLMRLAADRLGPEGVVGQRMFGWKGDIGPYGASLPLRFAGALNGLRLEGEPRLAPAYPPHETDDETLWSAVEQVLRHRADDVLRWLGSAPQTNEVRRAAGVIAAAAVASKAFGLPLTVSELGASAGLNLMFDRFALQARARCIGPREPALALAPAWEGPPPPDAPIVVADRRGVDLSPIDPRTPEGARRLRAYIWPDQPERVALINAAIAVAAAPVDRGDAIEWLSGRLGAVPGRTRFVFHTVAWQYFPARAQELGEALLAKAGAAATRDAPLARAAMEADGDGPGAALTLQLWPGGDRLGLGRMDFHGRWVTWRGDASD
jgi:hypothetical protein